MAQGPPSTTDLMYTDIWANKPVSIILSSLRGPSPRVNFVNGNTALGGYEGRQGVHADVTFNHATFPFAVAANHYLVDVSPTNGVTELWLGSHRDTTFRDHRNCEILDGADTTSMEATPMNATQVYRSDLRFGIKEENREARRAYAPPIQPIIPYDSIVLHDLRLWHAGIANPTPDPRVRLAFVYTPRWYDCPARVVLPESARLLVDGWRDRRMSLVDYKVRWVKDGVDYKSVEFTPNFSSANAGYLKNLPKGMGMGFVFGNGGEEEADEG